MGTVVKRPEVVRNNTTRYYCFERLFRTVLEQLLITQKVIRLYSKKHMRSPSTLRFCIKNYAYMFSKIHLSSTKSIHISLHCPNLASSDIGIVTVLLKSVLFSPRTPPPPSQEGQSSPSLPPLFYRCYYIFKTITNCH